MSGPPKETPPAGTEGADYKSVGTQEQATPAPPPSQSSNFIPSAFRTPPGLVGAMATYFYGSARYQMVEAAMLAALALMAGVAGRCFNFDGSGLNLYLLLLAESGRGKEDMRGGIDRLLAMVRTQIPMVDTCIGPDTFASGQALIRVLDDNPSFVSIQSEFGLRLKELANPHAPPSTEMLKRVLLDLYAKSGWNGLLRPMVYSDSAKNTKTVHAPCVTILGESTPGHVFDNLSFRDIEDGLLPRTLILECTSPRPRANKHAGAPPPPALVESFRQLAEICLTMRQNSTCQNIVATGDAAIELQEFQDDQDDSFNDDNREPYDRALWNRAGLNVRHIAALLAVGEMTNPACPPEITATHVLWATDFVGYAVESLSNKFKDGAVGLGEARQEAEIRKYVCEYAVMKPGKRRSYKVPKKLVEFPGVVGFDYLKRRAARCNVFTQDRRGLQRALTDTLNSMCRGGALQKLTPELIEREFGLRCEVYGLGDLDAWE